MILRIRIFCQIVKKITVLIMYADDILLLSESPESLQNILDTLHEYCNDWKLSVNVCKTKIIVLRKNGRLKQN